MQRQSSSQSSALSAIGTLQGNIDTLEGEIDALSALVAAMEYRTLRPAVSVTGNYTATPGQRIYADSTGGALNIKMPPDPDNGDTVSVYPTGLLVSVIPNDAGAATTIEGEASVTIDQTGVAIELCHMDGIWKIERRNIING